MYWCPMMEDVNTFIEARRQKLRWTDTTMTRRAGLSISEYCDIKWDADELATITPIMYARLLSEAIDVPVHALFGLEPMADAPRYGDRPDYIKKVLARRGVTAEQMADGVGFHDDFGRNLLKHRTWKSEAVAGAWLFSAVIPGRAPREPGIYANAAGLCATSASNSSRARPRAPHRAPRSRVLAMASPGKTEARTLI